MGMDVKKTEEKQKMPREKKQRLRWGYTTGSCAAAAAQAATRMLLGGQTVETVRLLTPKGIELFLEPEEVRREANRVSCAIRKDAGDDPDVTHGMLIYAAVSRILKPETTHKLISAERGEAQRLNSLEKESKESWVIETEDTEESRNRMKEMAKDRPFLETGDVQEPHPQKESGEEGLQILLRGGEGVGVVTLPGLEQPVGEAAINRVPREMILQEVQSVCREYGFRGTLEVTIFVPGGEKVAEKTFNPRLGIQGGISILGTSGIVEPMSEKALVATIALELKQKSHFHEYLLVTPGNYGREYLQGNFPFSADEAVKCSNYVGQTIDLAAELPVAGLLFVAHIGKFVKVAGGIMNTHSREADARMEILAACGLQAGLTAQEACRILEAVTTDEGLRIVAESGLWAETMAILMDKIGTHLKRRSQDRLVVEAIVFSHVYGELGRTQGADALLEELIRSRSAVDEIEIDESLLPAGDRMRRV